MHYAWLSWLVLALLFVAGQAIEADDGDFEPAYLKRWRNAEEPYNAEDEILLEQLIADRYLPKNEASDADNDLELELTPNKNDKSDKKELPKDAKSKKSENESPEAKRRAKKATMQKNGQREYESFYDPEYSAASVRSATVDVKRSNELHFDDNHLLTRSNMIFIGVVGICAAVAMVGTVVAGVAYYKLRREQGHSVYGNGTAKERRTVPGNIRARGDQKNAYSAQLHHYQQTKNEILRMEQAAAGGQTRSGGESEESEADDGDYSVYECPGLAPTGDIEVSNPMFDDQQHKKSPQH